MGVEGRPSEDEVDLIRRALSGEQYAYTELVRRFQQIALRAAYLIVGPMEAEDAVQDAFVKAYRALGRFRVGEPFRPWLMRIVTNEALNRRKSAFRRQDLALRLIDVDSPPATPEEQAVSQDEREKLLRAIASLSPKDRMIISYRHLLDMDEQEMAAILSIPRGTVKSRLSRAMARLRQVLEAQDG